MKQRILFIINPHSGVGKHAYIERIIESELDHDKYHYDLRYTSYAGHAREMAKEAVLLELDMVVAVGGDGTINEIASVLVHSNCVLGLIPKGSGNGLARHLKVSLKPRKALNIINKGTVRSIDAWTANYHYFFNVSGLGFDAEVAKSFAGLSKRGFQNYIKLTLNKLKDYKPKTYTICTDEGQKDVNAFMLSLANSSQFGNNAKIAPYADIQDGLIDICVIPEIQLQDAPLLAVRLFRGKLYKSKKVEFLQTKTCTIQQEGNWMHIDGDPIEVGNSIEIKAFPKGLKIITPF